MASRISTDTQKPVAVIFLDIEGVLFDASDQKIQEAAHQLINEWHTTPDNYSINLRRAITRYFSEDALSNLMKLIEKIEKVAKVGIVISSSWREEISADDLIKQVFVDMPFVDRIIDKIPDSHSAYLKALCNGKITPGRQFPSDISREKYGFSLTDDDRSKEIDFWLRENKQRFQIDRFVIINNYDHNIADLYPDHVVQVNPAQLFGSLEADEAYHILLRRIPSSETDESSCSSELGTSISTQSTEPEEKLPTRNPGCCSIL